jgi:coenzyme F420 hydrogenase subunit beta
MLSSRKLRKLQDVVDWGLCVGCGACKYLCNRNAVSMINIEPIGIRARFSDCGDCVNCLSVCPGYQLESIQNSSSSINLVSHDFLIGPTLECWEGYAVDPEIRFKGSSGGVLSALSLYCLEKESMEFVLHVGMDPERPWLNKTVQSKSRMELLQRAGSRYAPSSPCEGFGMIVQSEGPCVFIGKPCDAAAAEMLRKQRADLDKKLGLVLTFFCAGPPSTKATLNLLGSLKIKLGEIKELYYRGNGWPGHFKVSFRNKSEDKFLNYEESWGYLANHPRSFRCHLCPDGLGELADISCGDAWHRHTNNGNPGLSLILVRTERGKEILHRAWSARYVQLEQSRPEQVVKAQGMVQRRKEVYGRILAMRTAGIPTPRFAGFDLYESWLSNSLKTKIRTILGTLKRIWFRGMWHRNPLFPR